MDSFNICKAGFWRRGLQYFSIRLIGAPLKPTPHILFLQVDLNIEKIDVNWV